jgi:hypothetical protein
LGCINFGSVYLLGFAFYITLDQSHMGILGRPQGLFELHRSDLCVGSMLRKCDVVEILGLTESDVQSVPFKNWDGIDAIDERELQKLWYSSAIPNSPPAKIGHAIVSLDEMILVKLIELAYPNAIIEHQVPWGRRRVDLKISVDGVSKLVEFHGPSHLAASRFNPSPEHPSIRKAEVERHFGMEGVLWPYWIQRCISNVRAIFDNDVNGLGALWSTNVHFGTFVFPDSAQVIESINNRFRATRDGSCGYFYGPNTESRNNPEHPVISQIQQGKKSIELLLPRGHNNIERWVPQCLVA